MASKFGTTVFTSNAASGSVSSFTVSANTASGDLVVVCIRTGVYNSSGATVTSVTDSAGNTYTVLPSSPDTSGDAVTIAFCLNAIGNSSNTITAHLYTGSSYNWIGCWDTPCTGTVVYDTTAVGNNNGTSVTSGSFSTTGTDEIVFQAASPANGGEVVAAGAGYTSDSTSVGSSGYGGAGHIQYSSTQSGITSTMSWSGTYHSCIVVAAFYAKTNTPNLSGVTYVQSTVASALTAAYPNNVKQGNLLVCFIGNGYAITGISDTLGNSYTLAGTVTASGVTIGNIYWAVSKSSGANTITCTSSTSSNPGIVIAEYSGAGGLSSTIAHQQLADSSTSVSCGPLNINGAIVFIWTASQATGYTSSTGLTVRQTVNATRVGMGDNLGDVGSYTETGTLAGSMQYGGLIMMAAFMPSRGGCSASWGNFSF